MIKVEERKRLARTFEMNAGEFDSDLLPTMRAAHVLCFGNDRFCPRGRMIFA
jgi:hypothetical protein